MRTSVLMLIVCQALTSAQQVKIEHLAGGNMVSITNIKGSDSAKIYRAGKPSQQGGRLLLTHHRRDVLPTIPQDAHVVAPREEVSLFSKTEDYWNAMSQKRFHYYAQQSTKVLVKPVKVKQWVSEGDIMESAGIKFQIVATPGFTRGAISYLATIERKRCAFTGDLIYGDGKIFDLYSFQDAIPEAKVGGYHGYGGRLADLVTSLRKIKAWKPDIIYPARGPVINNPAEAIDKLINRVQALYGNYLSTNALHWYFKEERMRICGERVLGKGAKIDLMPYCLHLDTPDWIIQFSTSRIIVADNGHGFLLDCGGKNQFEYVKDLVAKGLVKQIDGIFVTHTHDDHSQMVKAAAEHFKCPVYATTEYEDVLENPGHYLMPGLTEHAVEDVKGMKDGETMKWHEYEFTFRFFPGQMYYHGALLVKRPKTKPVFFIGDSFAPSGIDDYCLLNRNLIHPDSGYPRCFKILRELPKGAWLINQHVPHVFRFSDKEMTYLETQYAKRTRILRNLFPWDDPNYGIDERWATFYPYGNIMKPGETREVQVRLTNHSPIRRTFKVTPHAHQGAKVLSEAVSTKLDSRAEGAVKVKIQAPRKPGVYVVTADIDSKDMHFRDWVETIIEVE
jgi:glyoxylase-like metal-dependent hydrolase (beta-lactamase superfamily II)